MTGTLISLDEAVDITRTGDLWLFRGSSAADRAIRVGTNSPVNHVGMSVVLDDLPPLLWHAELGKSLPDVWTGGRQRGVQLHVLRDAVVVWSRKYGQRGWLRQLDVPDLSAADQRAMEDAVLRTIARLDGTPFPSTARLAGRWLAGRLPLPAGLRPTRGDGDDRDDGAPAEPVGLESTYCAEVVARTYEAMDLLPGDRQASWYDPGSFWSGDRLPLTRGAWLSAEIAVSVPASEPLPAGVTLPKS